MRKILAIVLFLIILASALANYTKAYSPGPNSELIKKVISKLPYNWQYSFSSYTTRINDGIATALDRNVTLFYDPENMNGTLLNRAIDAYNKLIARLDEGDISSASEALGELGTYAIYMSNPFRTTKMKNSTLAQKLEALVISDDAKLITINETLKINDVKSALVSIGLHSISIANSLNKTALMESKRDQAFLNFIKDSLSYASSILLALLQNAISKHQSNSFLKNIIYMASLTFIIIALVVIANRRRFKSIRKEKEIEK